MRGLKSRIYIGAVLAGLVAAPAVANEPGDAPNRIVIEYGPAPNPAHTELREILQEHRILEQFRDFLAMLILPRPLNLEFDDCEGDADAWYEPTLHKVTICYEYIADLRDNAPKETTVDGVTPEDAVIGPVMEVVLHEVAHAVFHLLELPILGREEDAADQFAAVLLLQMGKDTARRTIAATAHMYWREAQTGKVDDSDFASAHRPAIQRFYHLVCIAYGWDSALFEYVLEKYLSHERAGECQQEVETLKVAFWKLVGPHIDDKVRRDMQIGDLMPAARRMLHGK